MHAPFLNLFSKKSTYYAISGTSAAAVLRSGW